ncbi:MAG: glycosyltransferase family 39 protein [Chitinophagaceae bacterium]|nr:glycosyltransferase family 39 protein [Chitinophagaceae bacterium]
MEIDSVQYANISREMLLNKSFLQIFDQGKDYLDKPPLLFWVSALSMYIFGINDIAFRIPSILMAVLAIYSTYKFTLLYYTKEIALLAALVLASSQAMFLITHDLRTDTMLMAWVILGIWQFSSWLFTKKWISFIIAFAAIAFGMMTKGPIALMVPIFSFAPHFLIHRNFKLFFKWEYLIGMLIILILLIPMDIGLYQQFDLHPEKVMYEKTGTSGLRFFYWTQSFGRITGESVWHENDYFFFLFENLLWGFLPWILFFIIGLLLEFYTILKNKFRLQSHEEWISTPGFLITYTALGISNYQLPHYIYIVLPFASIIAAKYIYSLITINENMQLKNTLSIINGILFSLVLFILIVLLVIPFNLNYYLIITTVLIFIIIFRYSIYKQKQLIPNTIHFALFTILITNLLLNVFFYPKLLEYQLGNSVTKYINTKKIDKNNFYLYKIYGERSLDFYSNYSFQIIEDEKALKPADYLLISNKLITKDLLTKFNTIETIAAFHVSTLNANFLNPKTRNSALDYYYILQKK